MADHNWEKLYDEYLASGLSKAAFAKKKRINEKTFYAGIRRIEKGNQSEEIFKEVKLIDEIKGEVIIFSDNYRIEIKTPINEDDFITILKAVKTC